MVPDDSIPLIIALKLSDKVLILNLYKRVGFGNGGGGFSLTNEVPIFPGRHQTDVLVDAVKVAEEGIGYSHSEIFLPEKERRFGDEFPLSSSVNPEDAIARMQIGAGYPSKIWMPERFSELIHRISKRRLKGILGRGK